MRTTLFLISWVPIGKRTGRFRPAFDKCLQLFAALCRSSGDGVGKNHLIADIFLRPIPIPFAHRCRQSLLVDFAAAEPNVLGVVSVAKDIREKKLVGVDSLTRIL